MKKSRLDRKREKKEEGISQLEIVALTVVFAVIIKDKDALQQVL